MVVQCNTTVGICDGIAAAYRIVDGRTHHVEIDEGGVHAFDYHTLHAVIVAFIARGVKERSVIVAVVANVGAPRHF